VLADDAPGDKTDVAIAALRLHHLSRAGRLPVCYASVDYPVAVVAVGTIKPLDQRVVELLACCATGSDGGGAQRSGRTWRASRRGTARPGGPLRDCCAWVRQTAIPRQTSRGVFWSVPDSHPRAWRRLFLPDWDSCARQPLVTYFPMR
jgi:hypothetical protein